MSRNSIGIRHYINLTLYYGNTCIKKFGDCIVSFSELYFCIWTDNNIDLLDVFYVDYFFEYVYFNAKPRFIISDETNDPFIIIKFHTNVELFICYNDI